MKTAGRHTEARSLVDHHHSIVVAVVVDIEAHRKHHRMVDLAGRMLHQA